MNDILKNLKEEWGPKIKELVDSNEKLSYSRIAHDASVLYDLTCEDIAHFLYEIGRLYHCGKYCNKEVSKDIKFALDCLYKSIMLGNPHAMDYYLPLKVYSEHPDLFIEEGYIKDEHKSHTEVLYKDYKQKIDKERKKYNQRKKEI